MARHPARVAALAAAGVMALASCSGGGDTIDAFAPGAWPVAHGDARNSNATGDGMSDATFEWSRPMGGTVTSPVSIGANGQMFVSADTEFGCNLFSFEIDSGRKKWCNRVGPSTTTTTPIVDSVANVYVGDDGGFSSFNQHGQLRWRTPVNGVPKSAQFLGDGSVLAVTQLGQVNVFDTQTGRSTVPIHDLIEPPEFLESPNTEFPPPASGLDGCATGTAECPVPSEPAVDLETSTIYLVLWRPGAIAPQLVSLRYDADATPAVSEVWSSELLPAAVTSSPVLSHDGSTVYLSDVEGRLTAFDTESGSQKWTFGAGIGASGTPSVSADGTIVPAGGVSGVRALSDDGDRATVLWERNDLQQKGFPLQNADGDVVVVAGDDDELFLTSLDGESGDTVAEQQLPGATGSTVGLSVGPDGQAVTSTYLGEIFTFTR